MTTFTCDVTTSGCDVTTSPCDVTAFRALLDVRGGRERREREHVRRKRCILPFSPRLEAVEAVSRVEGGQTDQPQVLFPPRNLPRCLPLKFALAVIFLNLFLEFFYGPRVQSGSNPTRQARLQPRREPS